MNNFSTMLTYFRKREGLTQQQLADAVHLSRSRISNYENGLREPDFETEELLADFFNTDISILRGKASDSYHSLPDIEQQLLDNYRAAPDLIKKAAFDMLASAAQDAKKNLPADTTSAAG